MIPFPLRPRTPLNRLILWLGSVRFAVPVLVLVAIALGVGTWLESTRDVRVARQFVYGSWWFVATMALVCASLICAVITRLPWKRRHIGFITVHAALVGLIVGGFWSMYGRVEGNLALQEGTQSNIIETDVEQLEVLSHDSGQFNSIASVPAPHGPGRVTLSGVAVQVLERWDNSRDEEAIADDSPVPLRAVEISPIDGPDAAWVGQEDQAGPAPTIMGMKVLVLPEGSDWQPPPPPSAPSGFVFVVGADRYPLKDTGEVFPGWSIKELKRFEHAIVSGEGITEGPATSPVNRAVRVLLTDGAGTVEQHTSFEAFPDMVMGKTLEGPGNSASRLISGSLSGEPETIVVFGTVARTRIGYIGLDGATKVLEPEATYPMKLTLGSRDVTIHRQLARAHVSTRTVRATPSSNNRPALLVRVGDRAELTTIAWKSMARVDAGDSLMLLLHFGPRRVELPFTVRLDDFRKSDYPGTDMAMAYQSDVGIVGSGRAEQRYEIYMNHPYAEGPWRVYQSGFMGGSLSIFSVMKDPGLPLTYLSSAVLVVGVFITFYSRSMSRGHPGLTSFPPTIVRESEHERPRAVLDAAGSPARSEPVGAGVG